MYNIIKDCSKCCTENKQDDKTNSKRMDIYVGEEHIREGLSEEIDQINFKSLAAALFVSITWPQACC